MKAIGCDTCEEEGATLPNGEPLLCWHGDPHGDGHPYVTPQCPAKPVRSTDLLVQAAEVARITGDTPSALALLLAVGGAGVSAKQSRRW